MCNEFLLTFVCECKLLSYYDIKIHFYTALKKKKKRFRITIEPLSEMNRSNDRPLSRSSGLFQTGEITRATSRTSDAQGSLIATRKIPRRNAQQFQPVRLPVLRRSSSRSRTPSRGAKSTSSTAEFENFNARRQQMMKPLEPEATSESCEELGKEWTFRRGFEDKNGRRVRATCAHVPGTAAAAKQQRQSRRRASLYGVSSPTTAIGGSFKEFKKNYPYY